MCSSYQQYPCDHRSRVCGNSHLHLALKNFKNPKKTVLAKAVLGLLGIRWIPVSAVSPSSRHDSSYFYSLLTVLHLCCALQEAHMQISTRTTWSTARTIAGFRHSYRSPPPRLRVPTRTAGRRRRLSCWCVTGPARDSKAAGTKQHSGSWTLTDFLQTDWSYLIFVPLAGLGILLFCIWSGQSHGMYFRRRSWRRCGISCAPAFLCRCFFSFFFFVLITTAVTARSEALKALRFVVGFISE